MTRIIHLHVDTKDNIGDKAIVMAIFELLKKNINITKYTPVAIEKTIKTKYSLLFDAITRRCKVLRKIFDNPIILKVFKLYKKWVYKKLVRKINSHEILIIGGGGIYSQCFFPLEEEIINKIDIPIILFSPGININLGSKMLSNEVKQSIIHLNKKATLSSVRDLMTKEFLTSLKLDTEYIGDPAILLEKSSKYMKGNPAVFKVGINIACHGWALQKQYLEATIKIFKDCLIKLKTKLDFELYYLKHHKNEKKAINEIQKDFPNLIICDYDPKSLKAVYSDMNLVLSMMLHSTIFAFSENIPFINIAYDEKNIAFMSAIGQKDRVIKVTDMAESNLYNLIEKALLSGKKKSNNVKHELEEKTNLFLEKIKLISPN